MSCNYAKCENCNGNCKNSTSIRSNPPVPMVSLSLELYNQLVQLKEEVERLEKAQQAAAVNERLRIVKMIKVAANEGMLPGGPGVCNLRDFQNLADAIEHGVHNDID